jgi:hypothetical protein
MKVHYSKHKNVFKTAGLMDGYGSIEGMEGPIRMYNNEVVYYDPSKGKYLPAKEVHRYSVDL